MENLLNLTGLQLFLSCALFLGIGIAECFFGYKIMRGWLVALGLCAGISFGYCFGNILVTQFDMSGIKAFIIIAAIIIVFSLVFSFLAYRFYLAAAFITNGFAAFIFMYSALLLNIKLPFILYVILGIAFGIAVGLLSVKFFQPYKIIMSSIAGGFLISIVVYVFLKGRFGNIINILPGLICGIVGLMFQLKSITESSSDSKKHRNSD